MQYLDEILSGRGYDFVYPRPQMRRDSFLSLNGPWDFACTRAPSGPSEYKETILVPFPPESKSSGIGRRHSKGEYLFYRRTFTLPEGFRKERVVLHLGAVDQFATVYIGKQEVASHAGGYLPFSVDITDALTEGENTLTVRAYDDLSLSMPYGKQKDRRGGMWYTPVSGIWQTVWLESVPQASVRSLRIRTDTQSVTITVDTDVEEKSLILGEKVYTFTTPSITIHPESPHLWSPEDPYLYTFTLRAGEDEVQSYFALRTISSACINGKPRLLLNGKPYFFHGLLDQGYYPDGIFLPETPKGFADDILSAKKLGFNTLRKHIKIEPQIFYYLCDVLGMAVFQDMVNNGKYSFLLDTALPTVGCIRLPDRWRHRDPKTRESFVCHMKETLRHLYNTPSVLLYTIFNEGWGQFCADEMYETAKAEDPTRLYDATSGWFWQHKSDVTSRHIYFKRLTGKPVGDRPLIISEFGGYSLRVEGHVFDKQNYGYKTFTDPKAWNTAVEELYRKEALPLYKEQGLSALIYTQLSDVEDETNGLITYDRAVLKAETDRFQRLAKEFSEK